MPNKVTISIAGPQGVGKTQIANLLKDALLNAGASDIYEDADGGFRARFRGADVRVFERQADAA